MNTSRRRGRIHKNYFTTQSGNTFKIHRSLSDRLAARKDSKARRKAQRLNDLPKGRVKRFFYHLQPKRVYHYWFSRDGGIMALKILGIGFISGFIILAGMFAFFRKDLPNLNDISGNNIGGSIRYYDRTGKVLLWEDYDAVKRIPVESPEISDNMRKATVAIEDKDFYKHGGFDVRGIARAGLNDAFGHGSTQGGSTITQQLVKLTQDWSQQRTISRKVKELILAVELERSYSKDQILTGYLNTAPYGNIEYGVEAAARDYFHKSAKDLTLDEATFLAAIPKSPSVYSPYGPYYDSEALTGRQHYILDQMAEQGMITHDQAEKAKKINTQRKVHRQEQKYAGIKAPYFVLAAKNQLEAQYGPATVKRSGWKVTTTLDLKLQDIAEKTVQDNRANALGHGADEQALVAEDVKTGQMVALVGGTDFNDKDHGKINYAQINIAPGSSFKPYDYASLIENTTNSGAGSVLYDSPGPLPGYPCTDHSAPPPRGSGNCLTDYDFRTPGPLTLRYALGGSRNIPAVKAMLTVGTDKVINTADAMMYKPGAYKCYKPGVDVNHATKADEAQCYGASAIGDGAYLHLDNHVNGLATMARLGNAIEATYILKIQDAGNKDVPVPKQQTKQVLRADSAYIVDNMASDPNASYLPFGYYKWHNYNGWRTAIKTGTTNNGYDGLMMAWNTQYAVGSWVGYHTRNQELSGAMEYSTTPLARGFMTAALDNLHKSPSTWTQPSGVKSAPAYVVRSHVGIGSVEPSPSTDIFPSWYQSNKVKTTNQTIDIVSNKLATDCTPHLARRNGTNAAADQFSADTFTGAGAANANTSQQDDVHKCGDIKPSIRLSISDNGNGTYNLSAVISAGTHPLNGDKFKGTVNFLVNGSLLAGGAFNVSGAQTVTYRNYNPRGKAVTVTAQVIDSVLYDSSDAHTISASSETGISLTSAIANGGTTTFIWTGGPSGTATVRRLDNDAPLCSSGSHSCPASSAQAPIGTDVYVQDSGGNNSEAITVSGP